MPRLGERVGPRHLRSVHTSRPPKEPRLPFRCSGLVREESRAESNLELRGACPGRHGSGVPGREQRSANSLPRSLPRASPPSRREPGRPEHSCRPAVDVSFRWVARSLGPHALAIVRTGMGSDRVLGAKPSRGGWRRNPDSGSGHFSPVEHARSRRRCRSRRPDLRSGKHRSRIIGRVASRRTPALRAFREPPTPRPTLSPSTGPPTAPN